MNPKLLADDLPRVTQLLPDELPRMTVLLGRRATQRRSAGDALRTAIAALGDPSHPEHAEAASTLIAFGSRAVPPLIDALESDGPWLTTYRAAEALGQIGDRRATGPLIHALHHPHSNVRWSAIWALAAVGDSRALWALRRVAGTEASRTSWGEPVADTAALAVTQLETRSALGLLAEPIKTALLLVVLFGALLFADNRLAAALAELRRDAPARTWVTSVETIITPEQYAAAADCSRTTTTFDMGAGRAASPSQPLGSVQVAALNVRARPWIGDNTIGLVHAGDALVILGICEDWYWVRLGDTRAPASKITGGEGWVSRVVLGTPNSPNRTAIHE